MKRALMLQVECVDVPAKADLLAWFVSTYGSNYSSLVHTSPWAKPLVLSLRAEYDEALTESIVLPARDAILARPETEKIIQFDVTLV